MATYLVCETFTDLETISWEGVTYNLGTDAFNDIVTAELVASQDSPDPENEIIVFAGDYTSSLNNFQNYEGITLNVTGVKYHDDDADKATVTLKTFKNNGIATFANAAFGATSVINNAGKTITLNGATFTADTVTNDGTFTIKGGATVNSTFKSTSIEKPGTIRLAGTINSKSAILGDNTISIASATTLDGATVVGGILDVKNHLTLKAATLTADTANITSGKYIIVDAGTSIINLDEVNFTGSTGITMKEGAFLTDSNIAGTVSVHTSATGDGATITGENTIDAILVPNKATAVKLNLLDAALTSDITVNGNGIVNALGDNVVTGDITNNGVINVADGNSLGLNDGDLANAGTINLTGSITTTTTAQIANSGNIIVTGTGDLAAAVVMGDNGKVVFGTVDAAAETTFNGSITDIYNNPNPATYGKSTVQVLNGEVEFAAGSVVDIQGDAEDNRFTVGFRDAAIDPATVAATATVKGTVASHNGTWIGAAGAYDESFFDKNFVLFVDGGSYTNDGNAFTVRGSGEVIVKNGGSLSITDAAIRSDITVNESSMTFGSGNLYAEEGYTATIAITDSALTVNNNFQIGNLSNADRKGALVLDNATVDGTGKLNVTFAGSVSAVDTNIDVAEVANAGSFTVSGDSSVSIGTLSGAIILNTASLTDSTIGKEAEFTAQSSLQASKQTGTSVIKTLSGTSTIDDSTIYVAGFHVGSYDAADAEAIGNTTVTISDTTLGVWMKTYHDDGPDGLFVGDATTDEVSDKKVKLEITEGSQVEARLVTVWYGASLVVSGEDTNLTVYEADVRGSDLEVKDGAEAVVELLDLGDSFKNPSFTTISSGAKLSTILKNGADRRIRIREGATLTVNGAMIELDTADQTANSKVRIDADGTLTLEENSELKMGWFTKDSTWKKEAKTHYINVGAKGSITVTDSTFDAANETVTNNGSFTVSGTSTINIGTLSGTAIEVEDGTIIKDSTIGGNLTWEEGTVTFKGKNSISRFEDYDKVVVGKGDSLTLTGSRPTLGYGREINVTGDIEGKATETDKTTVTKSFETTNGFSLYGTGTGTLNVTNAYFVSGGSGITLKPKNDPDEPGSLGTYTLTFTNSIADIKYLKMNETGNDITATVTFDASVLNHDNNITNADPGSTMTFKNGSVANATSSFKNGGVFQVLSGSKFTANGVIQYGENSGNDGAITVDGKDSVMTLVNSSTGHAFKSVEGASITVTNGGVFSANYVTNEGTITIDTASLLTGTALDNTNGTITIDATNLAADSYVKVIDLNQTSALTGVKVLGDAHAIYGADGDVVVTNISAETLYVNSAWTINPDTEKAYEFGDVVGEGMVYGINAFSDIATMVSGITSVTNKIKFLEGGTYDLNWNPATISQSMTFETDGKKPTIWHGEFNLGTKDGTGDSETYALNNDIYFFQFATNKYSPAVLTINAELSIAQGIWFKAGTKTTVTEKGSIQRIDQFPWGEGPAELHAGQFEVYGELTVNGTVNYFTQGATAYTFRIGNASQETYAGVLNVDGGKVHFMNNTHVDNNHPEFAPSLIDENGTVNLTNGGKLTVDQPLTNKGAITIDETSLLTGTTLDNTNGTITIDARNLAEDSYVKVIDLNQTSALTNVTVLGDAHAVYGADGDVVVTNITVTDLYVNSAWTGYGIGDPIEGETGKYYGINAFDTLAGASGAAAPSTDAVTINIAGDLGGKATFNYGQNVVITGTSDFNWQEGWLFIGRGDNGLPKNTDGATVTFKNATIKPQEGTSDPSMGFNVSCAKAGSDNVNDGILNIEDSTIDTDYMYDCNKVNISNSNVTALNLRVVGREGEDSRTGEDDPAVMNITAKSTVTVLENNGQTHGAEGGGVLNVTDSDFVLADTSEWKIEAKGVVNLNGNAEFTAEGAVVNAGAIKLEVLPKAETEVLTETESTETEEEVAFNKFTAKSISNAGTIDAKVGSTITTKSGSFTNKTGAEVTVLGDAEDRTSTVIDAKKGISNSGSFSVTNATINVDGDALANTTNGVLTITNSIVNVDASYAFNSWAGSTTLFATTVNATINVFGGSFTIGEGASTLNGGFSGTAKLADGAVLKDSTVKKAYGAADIGTFTIAADASVGISGKNTLSAAITNNGTITIDATSTLSANSIAGGTIELTNFADNATRPVITVNSTDFTAAVVWTYGGKDYTLDGATTYTDDKKFLVQKSVTETATTISVVNVAGGQSTLLVDAKWAGVADGTPVKGYDGNDYVIGFNAFGDFKSALAVAQTNKGATIDFGTASYVWAKAQDNDAYKADITTAGAYTLTNGDAFLLNYEVEIDTDDQTTFTIDDAFITLTKLTARKNTDITISDSRVDFNWFQNGSAYLSAYKGSTLTISNSMVGFDPYDNKDKAETPEGLSPAGTGSSAYWHWGPRVVVYGTTEITDSTMYIYVGQADNTGFDVLGNSDTTVSGSSISLARLNVGDHYSAKYLADSDDENNLNASLEISNSTLVNTQYRGDNNNGKPLNGIVVGSASNAGVKGALTVTDESLVDFTALVYNDAREVGLQVNNSGSTVTVSEDSTMILPKITNAGSITVDSGSTLTATGLISNSGSIEVKAGSTLSTTSTANPALNNQGTLTVNGSTVEAARAVNTGTMTIENGAKFYASILLENTTGGEITFNGATLAKKADSTDATSFSNWAGITQFNNGSTVNANIAVHNGQVSVEDSTVNGNVNVIAGSFTVGGEATLNVGTLTGTINVLDGAELTADITGAEEADSAVVFDGKTTGITLAEGAVINTVAENYGKVSAADDLQVMTLINGASDGSVKGTITADDLTAGSIENNNGAAHKGGSTIELTGDLVAAGDILNGAAPIVPGTDEPADKAVITAANITAGSITNFGTVGSQIEGKELATITLTASDTATGKLTNGLYGNVFATTLNAASIENEGGIVVENINITSTDGVIENKAGGKIAQDNKPMTIAAKEIKNAGEISTHGGAITATAITNNAYNADTNDGLIWTDSITANGTVTNKGKIVLEDALFANRVVNEAGEFTVNGESKIVAVSGVANSGNVVVDGGEVTFNGDVTAENLNTRNASATININNATVSVAGTIYYSGTIVATKSVLDGSKFSGTGTLKVVNSTINGITLNHGTMQLDTMSLADVTIDGAFDVVDDSEFSGVNVVEGLTVSEDANLTISAAATITSLTQPALTVTAGDLVNHGTITIDADGLEWGSTLKQLKVVSVTGEGKKAFSDGTITVKNAEDTMAIVQDDGIYLYYVKSSGETKTLFVNSAWSYAPGYEFDYDGQHLVFGVNAFQDADDIVFYANTDALVFVGGNTTPYADLDWSKDDVSVTIDGGLTANFSDITLGAATLTGNITANNVTFNGDAVLNGTADVAALNIGKTLAMDWINPIEADTLNAAPASITIDLSHDLETVGADKTVIATNDWSVAQFESAVADYDKNADIFKVEDGDLKLDAAAIGKVFSSAAGKTGKGYFTTVAAAVSDVATTRILIDSNDLVDGKVENVYLRSKRGVVLSSAGQISRSVFSGGYDVSTLTGVKYRPFSDNYKYVGEEGAKESTNITINGGTYNGYVIGADMILLDTEKETNVLFYRTGDSNLTINAGDFKASANGVRAIAGGMMYAISGSGKTGRAGLVGDVNLTITGGTFYGFNVYGGNYANNNKNYGTFTSIEGDITVTLDATVNKLVFGENNQSTGIITAGSYGPSSVDGSTKVVLTGDQGIEFQQLIGGCSGDIYSKDTKTDKWVNESMVTGSRTLSFTGFSGDLDFAKIHGFNTVSFEGANEINFDGEFHRYFNDEVTNWNFAADSEVTGSLSFDFLGDALNLDDFTTGGWELSNVSMDAATTVSFDGELATGNIEDGWTNAAGTLALSFDSEANKLSLASINIG